MPTGAWKTGIRRLRGRSRQARFMSFFYRRNYPLPNSQGPGHDQTLTQLPRRSGTKSGPSRDQVGILRNCLDEKGILEIMAIAGRTSRTKFRNQVLKPLLDAGVIEMTIPEKPRSSKQRYRMTAKGKEWLAKYQGEKEP